MMPIYGYGGLGVVVFSVIVIAAVSVMSAIARLLRRAHPGSAP
jgi:hypothetical protein